MLRILATIFAALLGLAFGSFLNVCLSRWPRRESIVHPRSHCRACGRTLAWWENIPLLSWIALRGRCRHCHAPISVQYPLVEALSACAAAAVVWKYGISWQALAGLGFSWTLIAAAGIDLRTQLLPDQLTLPLLWAGLLLALLPLFVDARSAIVGAALGYLFLWSVYWLFKLATGKEGMGYGDFKLLGALGAWMGLESLLPIVLMSSLIGALVGGAFLLLKRRGRATPIPFGPFLAAAGWIWFMAHDALLALYDKVLPL